MLDEALRNNHLAYTKALNKMLPQLESYAALTSNERKKQLQMDIAAVVTPIRSLSSGSKAGIISDVAGQIESHLEARANNENASPPTASQLDASSDAWAEALETLVGSITPEEFERNQARLLTAQKAGTPRPILFMKNRKEDGFLVLYWPEKSSYRIWINLHPKTSKNARKIEVDGLIDLRTGEHTSFQSRTGVLVPVQMAKSYQIDEFINKGRSQSAKLCKVADRDGSTHFEVHVTYEFEAAAVETRTIIAIDRGIYNLASIAVIDHSGRVLHRENIDGMSLRHVQRLHEKRQRAAQINARRYSSTTRRAMADEAVHYAANRIVELAKKHGSQVVMEDLSNLTNRAKPRARSNFNRVLNRSQYAKLAKALEYKLAIEGLPKPRTVNAAGTSQTCCECGVWSPKNRLKSPRKDGDGFDLSRFLCVSCGRADDADLNAAVVIGQKKRWRDQLPDAFRRLPNRDIPRDDSFEQFLKNSCSLA